MREQKKGKGKPKITLIKVVKNDTLIKNMTKSMVSDGVKLYMWLTLYRGSIADTQNF